MTAVRSGPDPRIYVTIFKIYRESLVFIFSLKSIYIKSGAKGLTPLKKRAQMTKKDSFK